MESEEFPSRMVDALGIIERKWIKMKQNAFEFSGTITKSKIY
jgi:hypothetical protein